MAILYRLNSLVMATLKQAAMRKKYYTKKHPSRTPALQKRPQVKGIITKVTTMTPKKPNSAIRHVAKVALTNALRVTARIPGVGYICTKYNRVLITGGRANDLPGVGYTLVRGVYDFSGLPTKRRRRSVYGTSRPDGFTKYVKKSLRSHL